MSTIDKILSLVRPPASNGTAPAPADSAAEIIEALAQLAAERTAAATSTDDLLETRASLLLSVDSDAEIARIDAEVDRLQLAIERLDMAEPLLLARLRDCQDGARREIFDELRETFAKAAVLYAESGRRTLRHRALLLEIRNTAETLGFRDQAELLLPTPHINSLGNAASLTEFELNATR